MAKDLKKIRFEPSELTDEQEAARRRLDDMTDRNEELCTQKEIRDACLDLYADIEKGFSDQWERSNAQMDYWDIYNCELGPKQFYSGNSKIFVPIVHDAVNARKVRNVNQIFPPSGKNVEVITSENKPEAMTALLEFYIRKTRLRSAVVPQLLKNGDVEGQYNVYMGWIKNERHVTWRVEKSQTLEEDPDIEMDDDTYWDIEEETVEHAYPDVEVLPDADVLVLPHTARSVEEALDMGGSATVLRRWSQARVRQMIRDEEIEQEAGESILAEFNSKKISPNPDKKQVIVDSAGLKNEAGKVFILVYETWTKLNIKGERRICRIRFGSARHVLSCKRNPYWCDQVPLISSSANATEGSFKGRSEIKNIETMQYAANDAVNEAMDSAAYALLPIVMTDPAKNPRVGSMIMSVAAIWETNPNDTQFAKFPPLWKDGFEIVTACKNQIFQTLGINPSMLPQQQSQAKGGKTNQAQVAQEQQIDILTVADIVTGLEGDQLTPILRWFIYLDHQFRDKPLTLRQFGLVGKDMNMQTIRPVQMDRRWEVKWFGVEAARSAQQMQLQMAGLNMVRGIPPQQYEGFKLNLAPVLQQFLENLFGPRIAGEVFQDIRKQLSLPAEMENEFLESGFPVPVSPMDNDQEHLKAHMQSFQQNGDPTGAYREHMLRHQMNMQLKQQAQMAQQGQQGAPGGAGPGVAGTPRIGARSGAPRGGQQPPGVLHQDQLRDTNVMPRARGAFR